jgi:O-acetylhomoserine (thiol)-lyase
VIVDGGKFDWRSGRFANFTTPDPSYHGLVYADVAAMGLPPFIIKARVQILRDIGACQAPFNSWNTLQASRPSACAWSATCANAQPCGRVPGRSWRLAGSATPACPTILTTSWPSVPAQGRRRHPGLWHSGRRRGWPAFIDNLQLFSHLANVGDAKSLAIHPATTTHSQLTADEMVTAGVTPDFIRLSVGLEDIEDILWDLEQALGAGK